MTGYASKRQAAMDKLVEIQEALGMYDDQKPAQEPVGRFAKFIDGIWREVTDGSAGQPLYTTPPQRPWVGLTDEQMETMSHDYTEQEGFLHGARWAQDKLKELNA